MSEIESKGKLKNFCIGLGIAGMASIGAATGAQAPGGCTGACAQCGTCGLGVLSLGLWLAEKRWRPIARIRSALANRSVACPVTVDGLEEKEMLK